MCATLISFSVSTSEVINWEMRRFYRHWARITATIKLTSLKQKEKTHFFSNGGLSQFIHMPLGLKNALSIFQGAVNVIFPRSIWRIHWRGGTTLWKFRGAKSPMSNTLRPFLMLLCNRGVTIKINNFKILSKIVKYVDHVFQQGPMFLSEHLISAIRQKNPN